MHSNSKLNALLLVLILMTAGLAMIPSATAAPSITNLSSTSDTTNGGSRITINGTGLQGATVTVDGVAGREIDSSSATQLLFTTPPRATAGTVLLKVTATDGTSSTTPFTYTAASAPTLNANSIGVGTTGAPIGGGSTQSLTLTGTKIFTSNAAGAEPAVLTIDGLKVNPTSVSSTQVVFNVPALQPGTYGVTLTNPDGQAVTRSGVITVIDANKPVVSDTGLSFSSQDANAPETGETLSGSAFAQGAVVLVGSTAAKSTTFTNANSLTFDFPKLPAGTYSVKVQNPDGKVSDQGRTVIYEQRTTSAKLGDITVTVPGGVNGRVGSTIGGTPLQIVSVQSGDTSQFPEGTVVTLGGKELLNLNVNAVTDTITGFTPPGSAGNAALTITLPDGRSKTYNDVFTYINAISVTSVTPSDLFTSGGQLVTVTGTNFPTGVQTIRFNDGDSVELVEAATATSTSVTFRAPVLDDINGANVGDFTIQFKDGRTTAVTNAFTAKQAPSPTFTELRVGTSSTAQSTGTAITGLWSGDQVIKLVGTNFQGGASSSNAKPQVTVTFSPTGGTNVAAWETTVTNTELTFHLPAPTSGSAPTSFTATVTTPDGLTVTTPSYSVAMETPKVPDITNPSTEAKRLDHGFELQSVTVTNLDVPTDATAKLAAGFTNGFPTLALSGQCGFAALPSGTNVPLHAIASNSLTIVTPKCSSTAGDLSVIVANSGSTSDSSNSVFVYEADAAITIDTVTAPSGGLKSNGGQEITVTGTGFFRSTEKGGDAATTKAFLVSGATTYQGEVVSVSQGAGTAKDTLRFKAPSVPVSTTGYTVRFVDGDSAQANSATQLPAAAGAAPVISGLSQQLASGLGSTIVNVEGSNFDPLRGEVRYGATVLTVDRANSTSSKLVVTIPSGGAATQSLKVTNGDGQAFDSLSSLRRIVAADSVSLASATVDVTSNGQASFAVSGIATNEQSVSVSFDGVPAIRTAAGQYNSPATDAGTYLLFVQDQYGQLSVTGNVRVTKASAPVVDVLQDDESKTPTGPASGGRKVTIFGANFATGPEKPTVLFGSSEADVLTVQGKEIQVRAPAVTAGLVDVKITNPDGQSATLVDGYRFLGTGGPPSPEVTSVSPGSGAAGDVVTITGRNFQNGAKVFFATTEATNVTFNSASSLTVVVPTGPVGSVSVRIVNPDNKEATLSSAFAYPASSTTTTTTTSTTTTSSATSTSSSTDTSSTSSSSAGDDAIAAANRRVDITVFKDGDDTVIQWELPAQSILPQTPVGVQVHRFNSPNTVLAEFAYADGEYVDSTGDEDSSYTVTIFYANNVGKFANGELDSGDVNTVSVDDGDSNLWWIILIIVIVVIVIVVVTIVLLVLRRKSRDGDADAALSSSYGQASGWDADTQLVECPKCDAQFEASTDPNATIVCPSCGVGGRSG